MVARMTTSTGVEVTVPDEAVEHYLQAGFFLDAAEEAAEEASTGDGEHDEPLEGEDDAEDSPTKTTRKRK